MGRGRRGAYKAEKRRKELKRIKKQEEKRKRRLNAKGGDDEGLEAAVVLEPPGEEGAEDVEEGMAEERGEAESADNRI